MVSYPTSSKNPQWPWLFGTLTHQVVFWYSWWLNGILATRSQIVQSCSISTREQMSPFYFKFQFRNVEYSSGRNKTLLCYRVDTPGGSTEPLKGYMEDEHATAHAEEAFFQQVVHSYRRVKLHYRKFWWDIPNSNTFKAFSLFLKICH